MALYLNTNAAYKDFQMLSNDRYFVDKSAIIEKTNERVKTKNRFLCVTKPRRFGKTSVLNMLGAYYGKAYPSKEIFDCLEIGRSQSYETYLNKYNIINFSMNDLPGKGNTYQDYIGRFEAVLRKDIEEAYPKLSGNEYGSLADLLAATGDEFIFIIDEWDYIFSHDLYNDNQGDFLEFLRDLLKDRSYVALMDEVLFFLKYNIGEVRDDVVKMVNQMPVRIDIKKEYAAGQGEPSNKKEIYSAMIIYGLLSYHEGELCIPNKELMIEFENALEDDDFVHPAD